MATTSSTKAFVEAALAMLADDGRSALRRSLPAGTVAARAARARRTFYDTFETVDGFVEVVAATLVEAEPLAAPIVTPDGRINPEITVRTLLGLTDDPVPGRGLLAALTLLGGDVVDAILDESAERCEHVLRTVAATAGWVTRPGESWEQVARGVVGRLLLSVISDDPTDPSELVLAALATAARPGYIPAGSAGRGDLERDLTTGAATADTLERSRNLRQHVVGLAAVEISEVGWRSFSVQGVAVRAGVPAGIVDRLFGGTDALLTEVVTARLSGLVLEVESLRVAGHGTPAARIQQALDLTARWLAPHPELIDVLRHLGGGSAARGPVVVGSTPVTMASLLVSDVAAATGSDQTDAEACACALAELQFAEVRSAKPGLEATTVTGLLAAFSGETR